MGYSATSIQQVFGTLGCSIWQY